MDTSFASRHGALHKKPCQPLFFPTSLPHRTARPKQLSPYNIFQIRKSVMIISFPPLDNLYVIIYILLISFARILLTGSVSVIHCTAISLNNTSPPVLRHRSHTRSSTREENSRYFSNSDKKCARRSHTAYKSLLGQRYHPASMCHKATRPIQFSFSSASFHFCRRRRLFGGALPRCNDHIITHHFSLLFSIFRD